MLSVIFIYLFIYFAVRFSLDVISTDKIKTREHEYLRCVDECCYIISHTLKLTSMPSKAVVML